MPIDDFILVVAARRYFKTAILQTTTTARVVDALEDTFATHGLPVTITSDNDPRFVSEEFRLYMNTNFTLSPS